MGHRVHNGFANDLSGVFGLFDPFQAVQSHPPPHIGADKGFRTTDLLGQRAANFFLDEPVVHLSARISGHQDLAGRDPPLWLETKEKQAGVRGPELSIDLDHAAPVQECLLAAGRSKRFQSGQVPLGRFPVHIVGARAIRHQLLKADTPPLHHQQA